MKRSNFFIPIKHDVKSDSGCVSANYMEKLGMVHQVGAGMYTHLPLGFTIIKNVKETLNKHLLEAGCAEHQFPSIQPLPLWEKSGRLGIFGNSIFTFKDQHNKGICLAPTHEILAAYTAKQFVKSYKDLPIRISQTHSKFRDEERPRGGLIRTREFTMNDLYSFDTTIETATVSFNLMKKAYQKTFVDMRIPYYIVDQDDMGSIGGHKSNEFHVLVEVGEDTYVDNKGKNHNSLEAAHIFLLGDHYTKDIQATYATKEGTNELVQMCSFGFGIERAVSAYIESHFERKGGDIVHWSWALTPFHLMVIGEDPLAVESYNEFVSLGYKTIIEDRDLPFGRKLKEAFLLGLPIYLIYGKKFSESHLVEVKIPSMEITEYVKVEELAERIEFYSNLIKAVELCEMNFKVEKFNESTKEIFVQIQHPSDLDNLFIDKIVVPSDLMGNFGSKKKRDIILLKSNGFTVEPFIISTQSSEKEKKIYNNISYIVIGDKNSI